MYRSMKAKVEHALEKGEVDDRFITGLDQQHEIFNKWTDNFTRQDHPPVIQVCISITASRTFFFRDKYIQRHINHTSCNIYPHPIYVFV